MSRKRRVASRTAQAVARLSGLVLVAAVVVVPGAAIAQWATLQTGSSGLVWSPMANTNGLVLTVSGAGHWIRKEFGPGEGASFALVDEEGSPLPDGVYKWEIRAVIARPGLSRDSEQGGPLSASAGAGLPAESGAFRILHGSLMEPGAVESHGQPSSAVGPGATAPAPTAQTIADSLTIQGNNPEIQFDDNSSSPGFPQRDWRLFANDTTSGGLDRFSVEDSTSGLIPFTIEGDAPANSIYVTDSGDVGFGTTTPGRHLHVVDGNTPGLRLEQDGSMAFSPQTWDVAGNETLFFVQNITSGAIPFEIYAGAPDQSLVVRSDGSILIGRQVAPDYVFSPDYSPMSLDDLERFVTDNRHLPDVPSGDEIETTGINLGRFQMALLKKVEELTLYALAEHREIETLKARLKQLENAPRAN
jgi:hypothetical protein